MEYTLILIKITDRELSAGKVQEVLTQYGCLVKVRLGLHDLPEAACSAGGLVILQLVGPASEVAAFQSALEKIKGLDVKKVLI